jgi:hypothetical protein
LGVLAVSILNSSGDLCRHLHVSDFGRGVGTQWIGQHGDHLRLGNQLAHDLQPLLPERSGDQRHAGGVAARPVEAGDETCRHRIETHDKHDRDGRSRRLGGHRGRRRCSDDEGYRAANQLGRQRRHAIVLAIGKAVLDRDVLTLRIPRLIQAAPEHGDVRGRLCQPHRSEEADDRRRRMLRARSKRPGDGRAAEERYELASPHDEHPSRLSAVGSLHLSL